MCLVPSKNGSSGKKLSVYQDFSKICVRCQLSCIGEVYSIKFEKLYAGVSRSNIPRALCGYTGHLSGASAYAMYF